MTKLLWKDYRLHRPLLLLAALVYLMLYLVGAVTQIAFSWPTMPSSRDWGSMCISYGTVGLYLSCCFTGLWAAHAIACERADRSVNFLGYLPPTKPQILASKFAVAGGASLLVWACLLLLIYGLGGWLSAEKAELNGSASLRGLAALCTLTFGVGWLASASMEKTTIPTVLALTSPIAVSLLLLTAGGVLGLPRFEIAKWSDPACFSIGAVGFLAGTWNYLRRVEP